MSPPARTRGVGHAGESNFRGTVNKLSDSCATRSFKPLSFARRRGENDLVVIPARGKTRQSQEPVGLRAKPALSRTRERQPLEIETDAAAGGPRDMPGVCDQPVGDVRRRRGAVPE